MKQYIFLCGTIILTVTAVMIVFVVSTAQSINDDPEMENGNRVFMGLSIALLAIILAVCFVCLITCHHMENESNQKISQGGAYYKFTQNLHILKQSGTDCPICWEDMAKSIPVAELSCRHAFHPKCIEQHFTKNANTCPMCRSIPIKFPGAKRVKFSISEFFGGVMSKFKCTIQSGSSPPEWV